MKRGCFFDLGRKKACPNTIFFASDPNLILNKHCLALQIQSDRLCYTVAVEEVEGPTRMLR